MIGNAGRYALPLDDQCQNVTPTVVASAEDSSYLAENLVSSNPAKPAKLTTTTGNWVLDFGAAVSVAYAALIYHNLPAGATVKIQGNAANAWGAPSVDVAITIPSWTEDGWSVNCWKAASGNYRYWRLVITATSSTDPVSVGRLMLLGSLRDLGKDVRYGGEEMEDHALIELPTELGVETLYVLTGKRRAFSGELAINNTRATTLITLIRSASGRSLSWLLIPDTSVNDCWLVRFESSVWSRVRETADFNVFPFRVKELSRGLPWP